MQDVTASYGMPFDFIVFLSIFVHFCRPFMSELLYLHQTFTDCISNQYLYVKISDLTASYGMPLNFIPFLVEL